MREAGSENRSADRAKVEGMQCEDSTCHSRLGRQKGPHAKGRGQPRDVGSQGMRAAKGCGQPLEAGQASQRILPQSARRNADLPEP